MLPKFCFNTEVEKLHSIKQNCRRNAINEQNVEGHVNRRRLWIFVVRQQENLHRNQEVLS